MRKVYCDELKKKIKFEVLEWYGQCDLHPQSEILSIYDPQKGTTTWCLGCLYKMLRNQTEGQWNFDQIKEDLKNENDGAGVQKPETND